MPNPFDQFDAAAPTASAANPFDQFETDANPFSRFDDAGNLGGIVNATRRAGRSSLAGLNVIGAMAAGAKRDDYLAEADRLDTQAAQIDQLAPTWQPDARTTWATRAKSTAAQLRERAGKMDASATSSLESAVQQTRKAEAIPISEDYRAYGEAQGWDAVKQFLKNPVEIPLTIAAEGMAGSVPALVAGATGAATAGVPGLVAGTGIGSFATEYASSVLDTLREQGIDAEDTAALRSAFADPELMAQAKKRALARGIPVAIFDAISGGIAGRTVAPVVKSGVKQIAKATAKEVGEQAALGMAGETAGQVSDQLATKGEVTDLSLKDIVAEGIGEVVPGVGQIAMGAMRRGALDPLRKSANDKPATPPAPEPPPAATTGAPVSATPSAPPTDLTSEIGASLPDAESRDVLAGRSTEAESRKLATATVDFGQTVTSVQDALLTAGATPAQLDALDFQLRTLAERKDARRLKPEQVNTSLANTFLFQALPAADVFPLVSRLAADSANIQQLRAGITALRTAPAAPAATATPPTPSASTLTPAQRAAKQALLVEAEQEAAAAKARADAEREQARLKAEADAKAQTQRVRAENARLAQIERTGRDETGKIADLTRVPDTDLAALDLEREGISEPQFAAEMERRARAEERSAATAGNRGEELLDVLAQVKLPGESATLPEELRTLIREGMTPKQRMALVRAGNGELDRTAEALRERGFTWAKTPADVIDHVQRALRGETIYAEGDRDDIQFARRPARTEPAQIAPLAARWFENLRLTAPAIARQFELRFGSAEQLVAEGVAAAEDITGEEEAASLRNTRGTTQGIIYLFDRALRKNTDQVTRLNLLHEIGHLFFDTLDTSTRRTLREQWQTERDTRTGPLFDAEGNLRENVAVGVFDETDPEHALHEWFAERLAHANDGWAKRRTDARARGDGLMRTLAAEFRALLVRLRETLERAFGLNGYDEQLVSDFRKFLDQGDRWNQDGPTADAELAGSFAKTGLPFARREDSEMASGNGAAPQSNGSPQSGPAKARVAINIEKSAEVPRFDFSQSGLVTIHAARYRIDEIKRIGLIRAAQNYFSGLPENTFVRVAHNKEDYSHLKDGTHRGSFNRREGTSENGLSVGFTTEIPAKYAYFVEGKIDSNGADGEPVLNLASAKPVGALLSYEQMRQKLDDLRKKRVQQTGWTPEQVRSLLSAPTWQTIDPSPSRGGNAVQFARRTEANPEGRETDQLLRDYASLERTRDRYVSDGERVPRHILTGLADLREALEESLPGWREQAKTARAEQDAATAPGAEPELGASALFPTDEGTVAPDDTAAKRSQLEASTLRRPQTLRDWLGNLGKLFTNFRSAIPELPGGATGRAFIPFRQGYRMMKAATEFTRKDAEEKIAHIVAPLTGLGREAIAPETYRELQQLQRTRAEQIEAGKPIRPALTARIAALDAQLDAVPYHLFRKVALYRDLFFRSRLETPNGEPLRLPFGLTAAEIETTLRDLHAKVKASPAAAQINESLRRHYALVKEVRDGLLSRGYIIPEELRNPLYFPHIVLDKNTGAISRVKLDTAEDFRGYLVRLVGSDRAIESDYLQAMYYHLATVEAHNARQDIVEKYWQPYDIKADLVKDAAERTKERRARGLGPINWRQLVPEGHVIYTVDDRIPLRPEYMINRQVLAEKLGVQLGEGDLQKQLRDLGLSVTLTAEDFQQALMAGEKTQWVVPKPVADALRAILDRESRTAGLAERVLTSPQSLWKRWTLFAPQNVVRYTYGNMVADLEKLFSADPGVFRQLLPAFREIFSFYYHQEKPSADLRAAFERGVIDTVTAAEVTTMTSDLAERFAHFLTTKEKVFDLFKWTGRIGVTVNRYREATFRYAKFKADMERQRAGAEPIYAGAYNRDVRAIEEATPEATHYARAAEISRKTFGDYADISVSGDGLRKYFIPFYSWMEVNFRYHANLFRNLGDMSAGAGAAQVARGAATAASRILVARSVTGVLLRLAVPYAAVLWWNNSGDREELEKTLSDEDRRRFHVILGKDAQGRTLVTYAPTALSDVMKWIGGNEFARLAAEYIRGDITLPQLAHEWISNTPGDVLNNAVQGISPQIKAVMIATTRKQPFPDILNQRSIADHDYKWAILGSTTDGLTADALRRLLDGNYYSPKSWGDWAQQNILQARRRDPEQWGYYATMDRVAAYQAAHGGTVDFGVNNKADAAMLSSFRRAIRAGDVPAALTFYQKLLDAGYTAERFRASIDHADPLATLKREVRKEFVAGLSPTEQEDLRNGYRYAARMQAFDRRERLLFPSDRAAPAYRSRFAQQGGRPDVFAGIMKRFAEQPEEQLDLRADQLMRGALRAQRR